MFAPAKSGEIAGDGLLGQDAGGDRLHDIPRFFERALTRIDKHRTDKFYHIVVCFAHVRPKSAHKVNMNAVRKVSAMDDGLCRKRRRSNDIGFSQGRRKVSRDVESDRKKL